MTSDEAFLFRERTEVEEYVARNCYWDKNAQKNETRDRGRVSLHLCTVLRKFRVPT